MDRITHLAYRAEWAVEEIPAFKDSYYTIEQAKTVTKRILGQSWFKRTHTYCMNNLEFYMNYSKTQIRKGKARPRAGHSAKCIFHSFYDTDRNYASVVFASTGTRPDVARRVVIHELSHFLCGPYEGHGAKWRATFVAFLEKCDLVPEAMALREAYNHFRIPLDENWYGVMMEQMQG